jgi:hypothetical protein
VVVPVRVREEEGGPGQPAPVLVAREHEPGVPLVRHEGTREAGGGARVRDVRGLDGGQELLGPGVHEVRSGPPAEECEGAWGVTDRDFMGTVAVTIGAMLAVACFAVVIARSL